jgi:hypothetical protein
MLTALSGCSTPNGFQNKVMRTQCLVSSNGMVFTRDITLGLACCFIPAMLASWYIVISAIRIYIRGSQNSSSLNGPIAQKLIAPCWREKHLQMKVKSIKYKDSTHFENVANMVTCLAGINIHIQIILNISLISYLV